MTQPTAAECIRMKVLLKPPKPKDKPCKRCGWWHGEVKK